MHYHAGKNIDRGGDRDRGARSPKRLAKDRLAGGVLFEVIGLRIELRSERDNLILVYRQSAKAVKLAYGVIFKILFGHFPIGHFHER